LVSAKLLFESPQISALVVPGKKEGDEGYFSPHNLLVRLRTAILPFMRELWESPWLLEAPVGVIKSVTHIVLEIVKGENEESNGQPGISLSQTMAMIAPQPVQPDENRIQQITDMGFSRSAARRALTRARNNVATATELLLSQPYLFPPEADAPEDQDMDAAPPAPAAEAPAASSTTVAPEPTDPLTSSAPPTKTAEQWLNELKEARQPLQDGMGQFSLRLVDAHPGLIFDVQSVFVGGRGSYQEKSIHRLIEDVKVFSPAAYDVQEQPMAVRCRLLALTLTNPPSQDLLRGEAKNLMDVLLALLLSSPGQGDPDPPPPPKWLAAQLLVVEELLMMGEQPRAVTLPAEGEAPPEAQDIREGPMYQDARNILFETCMRLISGPAPPPPTDLLSSLRMLILLTREHSFAIELVKRDGVAALLKCLKLADRDTEIAVKSHVMVVLRHVVEDPKTLRNIMQVALRRFFSNPKTRSVELSTFVKSCSSVALRDPPAFVESTASTCVLTPAFGNHQHVEMKSAGGSASEGIAGIVPTNASSAAMQVDIGTSSASPQALDALVHALVKELMEVTKPAQEPLPGAVPDLSTQGTDAAAVVASEGSAAPKPGSHDVDQAYACFIMQVLTELLFSYDSCKLAFLSYSDRKRNQTPSKESAMRSRSTALQYVLGELVKLSSIEHAGDSLKHNIMCSWGMSVIVALCVDTAYVQDMKDLSPDVVSVRKAVLDAVSRALRELPSGGDVESGYGRLMALGDLTYRLLTVRPHSPSKKPPEDTPTHIAKLMIERNFVPNFTNALADVDLHYPNVRNVVTAVLKPLELLYVKFSSG
jgi:E3 ubiquitin-protein ligase HUWE1